MKRVCHHSKLIFVFLIETGFHHIGQAGLELLASSAPPNTQSPEVLGLQVGAPGMLAFSVMQNPVLSVSYLRIDTMTSPYVRYYL